MYEFVPVVIFDRYDLKSKWFIRPEIIGLAQFYRNYFGRPVYINHWYCGGPRYHRGFRTPNSLEGVLYSQHKLGAAFDCNIQGLSPDEVRSEIIPNAQAFMDARLTHIGRWSDCQHLDAQ